MATVSEGGHMRSSGGEGTSGGGLLAHGVGRLKRAGRCVGEERVWDVHSATGTQQVGSRAYLARWGTVPDDGQGCGGAGWVG